MNALLHSRPRPQPSHTVETVPINWAAQPKWAEWAIMDDRGRWWVFKREAVFVPRDGLIERGDWFADDSYDSVSGAEKFYSRMADEPAFGLKASERKQWMESKRSRRADQKTRRDRG